MNINKCIALQAYDMKRNTCNIVRAVLLWTVLPLPAVCAHAGSGIAVGSDGSVYCVHTKKSQILRVTPDGEVSVLASGVIGHGDSRLVNFEFPHHLEIDDNDNIYIADDSGGGLWQIKPNGDASHYWPPRYSWQTTNVGVLGDPFAIDGDKRVYVVNHPTTEGRDRANDPQHAQIIGWSKSLRVELVVGSDRGHADGKAGDARFGDLFRTTLKIGPDSVLFVGEPFSVRTVTRTGSVTTLAGADRAGFVDGKGATARFDRIGCISIDNNGNVFVADAGNRRIRKITADRIVTTIAGNGKREFRDGSALDASFYRPFGIASGSDGTVFVMDGLADDIWGFRLRKIETKGNVTTIAKISG